jgi:uncharacterized protein
MSDTIGPRADAAPEKTGPRRTVPKARPSQEAAHAKAQHAAVYDDSVSAGVVHEETVPGGRYWSMIVRRGYCLRLEDLSGRANVAMLLFNPHNRVERYNMSDTLKAQHTCRLTRGNMLYSDMGRVMMSIVEDSLGWHDPIGGFSDASDVRERYGEARYQEHRNGFHRNGRELFLIELAKWDLDQRDLVPNVNFFTRVEVGHDGTLGYVAGHSRPGAVVGLRAEMDTLVVLNTALHPMDPRTNYDPGSIRLEIRRAAPIAEEDYCIGFRPENARAFTNTAIHNRQLTDQLSGNHLEKNP